MEMSHIFHGIYKRNSQRIKYIFKGHLNKLHHLLTLGQKPLTRTGRVHLVTKYLLNMCEILGFNP